MESIIYNMATLLLQQQQQKYKQHNTVNDNITIQLTLSSIFTTKTQQQDQNQYQHHHHHNCHNSKNNSKQQHQHEENKSIKDVEEEFGYIYHIKQCYQQLKKLKTAITKSGTLNQRTTNDYNYFTPTLTKEARTTATTKIPTTALRTKPTAAAAPTTSLSHVLNSLSNNCRSFVSITLLFYFILIPYAALAAPQSCILCDKNDLLAKDPQTNYEEFLFEHQVTRQDAINALRQLNDSFYEGTASDSSCNGVRCTEKVMKYCLGPQFINDHCWCEVGHSTEGLPFVPHICYVGEKIYKTSVGSCFFYEEVKDCCCSSVLAKEWRHISAGSSIYSKTWLHNYYVLVVFTLLYLLIRRAFN